MSRDAELRGIDHIEALRLLRVGVKMDAAYDPEAQSKLAALDAAIALLTRTEAAQVGDGAVASANQLSANAMLMAIDRIEGDAQWNDWSQGRILVEVRNYVNALATKAPDPKNIGEEEVANIASYADALERMSLCNARTADGFNLNQAARFIREYCEQLRTLSRVAVQEGVVLVPREPTDDMVWAGRDAWTAAHEAMKAGESRMPMTETWRAMLVAASQRQDGGSNG